MGGGGGVGGYDFALGAFCGRGCGLEASIY